MTMSIRVRFAPSPTGHLHIGSTRTALFNWLLARHENGCFILRIEDTDRERSKEEYLEAVLQDLRWLGLEWEEGPGKGGGYGPYFQSQRLEIYHRLAEELVAGGKAYPCYCAAEELAERRERAQAEKRPSGYEGTCRNLSQAERQKRQVEGKKSVLRFSSPKDLPIQVNDTIRGVVDFSGELLEDFVILKSDGYPTYNFACAIDDHEMKITHVLRGEEHLSNTPRQLLLYRAFGWEPPVFGHLSIILDEHRRKLSKREGATYLSEFREAGYLPAALINFLALLGWAPKENLELLELPEIIRRFGFPGMGKSPAIFDGKKLDWMNREYMKQFSKEELARRLLPFLRKAGILGEEKLSPEQEKRIADLGLLFRERVKTFKQLASEVSCFLTEDYPLDKTAEEELLTPISTKLLKEFIPELEKTEFLAEPLEISLRSFAERKGIQAGELIHPLRFLLTGKRVSPGIFQVLALLGKEKTIHRIKRGLLQ